MFPPGRIVCLTEETVETLYLLGEQDRIVGISGYVVRAISHGRAHSRLICYSGANGFGWSPGCCIQTRRLLALAGERARG